MTAQWYADAERNLRKAVGLALKPIKANHQLGLLLTKAFVLAGVGRARTVATAVVSCVFLLGAVLPAAAADQNGSSSRPTAPADGREALQRAAHLVQQGHLEEAEAQVQLALSNPETRGAAHSVLGAIRFQQERLDESARLLQEAIRLEPRLIGAHLTLAEVRIAQGQPELAVRCSAGPSSSIR